MSGKDASRGYLFQTIIAALDSLHNPDWETVTIEPDTANQKTDIIWAEKDLSKKVCQVKSSINGFDKAEILNWLQELVHDVPNAKKYQLTLIGNCSGPTKRFFNNFQAKVAEKEFGDSYPALQANRKKIEVQITIFDQNILKSAITNQVHKFLSNAGIIVPHSTVELIADGLLVQFLTFSTIEQPISREMYNVQLLDWVERNYKNSLKKGANSLELFFYFSKNISFTKELEYESAKKDIRESDFVKNKISDAKTLIEEIQQLSSPSDEPLQPAKKASVIFTGIPTEAMSLEDASADIAEERMLEIRSLAHELLGMKLQDYFFDLKNLKQSIPRGQAIFERTKEQSIRRSAILKKQELLDTLLEELRDLADFLSFFDQIMQFRKIPIVLKNNSSMLNEAIDIKLYFPKEAQIERPKNYPSPQTLQNLKFFNRADGILPRILKHQADSKVDQYDHMPFMQSNRSTVLYHLSGDQEKIETELSEYYRLLKHLFDFKMYQDDDSLDILACEISALKPNATIALPCYLLTTHNKNFTINYEINSKNLPSIIHGSLSVKGDAT